MKNLENSAPYRPDYLPNWSYSSHFFLAFFVLLVPFLSTAYGLEEESPEIACLVNMLDEEACAQVGLDVIAAPEIEDDFDGASQATIEAPRSFASEILSLTVGEERSLSEKVRALEEVLLSLDERDADIDVQQAQGLLAASYCSLDQNVNAPGRGELEVWGAMLAADMANTGQLKEQVRGWLKVLKDKGCSFPDVYFMVARDTESLKDAGSSAVGAEYENNPDLYFLHKLGENQPLSAEDRPGLYLLEQIALRGEEDVLGFSSAVGVAPVEVEPRVGEENGCPATVVTEENPFCEQGVDPACNEEQEPEPRGPSGGLPCCIYPEACYTPTPSGGTTVAAGCQPLACWPKIPGCDGCFCGGVLPSEPDPISVDVCCGFCRCCYTGFVESPSCPLPGGGPVTGPNRPPPPGGGPSMQPVSVCLDGGRREVVCGEDPPFCEPSDVPAPPACMNVPPGEIDPDNCQFVPIAPSMLGTCHPGPDEAEKIRERWERGNCGDPDNPRRGDCADLFNKLDNDGDGIPDAVDHILTVRLPDGTLIDVLNTHVPLLRNDSAFLAGLLSFQGPQTISAAALEALMGGSALTDKNGDGQITLQDLQSALASTIIDHIDNIQNFLSGLYSPRQAAVFGELATWLTFLSKQEALSYGVLYGDYSPLTERAVAVSIALQGQLERIGNAYRLIYEALKDDTAGENRRAIEESNPGLSVIDRALLFGGRFLISEGRIMARLISGFFGGLFGGSVEVELPDGTTREVGTNIQATNGQTAVSGDPVDTSSGQVIMSAVDIGLTGPSGDFAFTRHYRSDSGGTGLFGRNWSSVFDEVLEELYAVGNLYIRRRLSDGVTSEFVLNNTSTPDKAFWRGTANNNAIAKLITENDFVIGHVKGGMVVRQSDGSQTTYCPATHGLDSTGAVRVIRARISPSGAVTHFIWSKDGRPREVRHEGGGVLSIEYNPLNPWAASKVRSSNGDEVSYEYYHPKEDSSYHRPTLKRVIDERPALITSADLVKGDKTKGEAWLGKRFDEFEYAVIDQAVAGDYSTFSFSVNAKISSYYRGALPVSDASSATLGSANRKLVSSFEYYGPSASITEGRVKVVTEANGTTTSYSYDGKLEGDAPWFETTEVAGVNTQSPLTKIFRFDFNTGLTKYTLGSGREAVEVVYDYLERKDEVFEDKLPKSITRRAVAQPSSDHLGRTEYKYQAADYRNKYRLQASNVLEVKEYPGSSESRFTLPSFISGPSQTELTASYRYEPLTNMPIEEEGLSGITGRILSYQNLSQDVIKNSLLVKGWEDYLDLSLLPEGYKIPQLISKIDAGGRGLKKGEHYGLIVSPAIEIGLSSASDENYQKPIQLKNRPYSIANYDSYGRILAAKTPAGLMQTFNYDQRYSRPIESTSVSLKGNRIKQKFTFDPMGRLLTAISPLGVVTTNFYDKSGQKIQSGVSGISGKSVVQQHFFDVLGHPAGHSRVFSSGDVLDSYGPGATHEVEQWVTYEGVNPVKTTVLAYKPDGSLQRKLTSESRYGANEQLLEMVSPTGEKQVFQYNSAGLMTRSTKYAADQSLIIQEDFIFNPSGQVLATTLTNRNGSTKFEPQVAYDGFGRAYAAYDPINETYSLTQFDRLGRPIASFEYLADGTLISQLEQQYDGRNLVTSSRAKNFIFNQDGSIAVASPEWRSINSGYSKFGLLENSILNPGANQQEARYVYNEWLDLSESYLVGSEDTTRVVRTYDQYRRPSSITKHLDGLRRNSATTNPSLTRVTLEYNSPLGTVSSVRDLLGSRGEVLYDDLFREIGYRDEHGVTRINEINSVGELQRKSVRGSNGELVTLSYLYDGFGRLTGQVDPNGKTTNYHYNRFNQVEAVVAPNNSRVQYQYDAWQRLSSVIWPHRRLVFHFDSKFRNYQVEAIGGNADVTRTTTFTNWGFPQEVVEQVAARQPVSFRASVSNYGGVTQETLRIGTQARTILRDFDNFGRYTRLSTPAGGVFELSYDGAGRLSTVSALDRQQSARELYRVTARYGDLGRQALYGSRYRRELDFDVRGRRLADRLFDGNATIDDTAYGFNQQHLIDTVTRANQSASFGYDGLARLTSATIPHGASRDLAWQYDGAGNWISNSDSRLGNFTNQVDDNNRYLQFMGDASFQYAEDDSLISTSEMSFQWDALGRPYGITKAGGDSVRFTYDSQNRLVQLNTSGASNQTIALTYDGSALIGRKVNTGPWEEYVHLPGGIGVLHDGEMVELLSQDVSLNAVASIDMLSGATQRFSYDPYGASIDLTSGAPASTRSGFGFLGKLHVPTIPSLVLTDNRLYSTSKGRFLSQDPIKDDEFGNLLSYPGQSPLMVLDPTGLGSTELPKPYLDIFDAVINDMQDYYTSKGWGINSETTWLDSIISSGARLVNYYEALDYALGNQKDWAQDQIRSLRDGVSDRMLAEEYGGNPENVQKAIDSLSRGLDQIKKWEKSRPVFEGSSLDSFKQATKALAQEAAIQAAVGLTTGGLGNVARLGMAARDGYDAYETIVKNGGKGLAIAAGVYLASKVLGGSKFVHEKRVNGKGWGIKERPTDRTHPDGSPIYGVTQLFTHRQHRIGAGRSSYYGTNAETFRIPTKHGRVEITVETDHAFLRSHGTHQNADKSVGTMIPVEDRDDILDTVLDLASKKNFPVLSGLDGEGRSKFKIGNRAYFFTTTPERGRIRVTTISPDGW